ncbi:hypothetical protein ACH4TX_28330 [Streptomyces sp. NPDC021098]|uniref:hypothetical protein n=1 Tax=unclassified Streptomyces TaxID=2593676 RepID=UPI0037AE3CDE
MDSDALDAYIRARLALAGVDIDQLPDVADPETGTPTRAVIMLALREFVATTPGALADWTPPTGGVGGALGAAYAQQEAAPLAYPSITTAWTGEADR